MAWKWYDGILTRTEPINDSVRRFWVDPKEVIDFEPGQFVTMDLPIAEKRLKRWRSYSIASVPQEKELEFCIVNLEGGLGTSFLFKEINLGDTIRFKGPSGTFVAPKEPDFDIVMICTGTGVAPFRPMIYDLLEKQNTSQKIHLIFGTRTEDGILYRSEFEKLAKTYSNFSYDVCLSRDQEWQGTKGYVHQVYLDQYKDARSDVKFFLCGWSNMIDEAVSNLLTKLKYDRSQIVYELYG